MEPRPLGDDIAEGHVVPSETISIPPKEVKRIETFQLLERGVEAITSEENFRSYLEFSAKFHDYSFGNQILIMTQDPEASRVAGYKRWQALGRQVKKGEQGIRIMVPHVQNIEDEESGQVFSHVRGFGVGHVFDVRQTEGDPLPEPPIIELGELTGDDPLGDELFSRLSDIAAGANIQWGRGHMPTSSMKGYFAPHGAPGGFIMLSRQISGDQEVKTFAHEIGHGLAQHSGRVDRRDAETVAESTAFVTLNHFGLDTSDYSFPYVASWSQDMDRFRKNLDETQRLSNMMIHAITGDECHPGDETGA